MWRMMSVSSPAWILAGVYTAQHESRREAGTKSGVHVLLTRYHTVATENDIGDIGVHRRPHDEDD